MYLKEVKLHSRFALILSDGKELHEVVMTNVSGKAVSVLVHQPLTAVGEETVR